MPSAGTASGRIGRVGRSYLEWSPLLPETAYVPEGKRRHGIPGQYDSLLYRVQHTEVRYLKPAGFTRSSGDLTNGP